MKIRSYILSAVLSLAATATWAAPGVYAVASMTDEMPTEPALLSTLQAAPGVYRNAPGVYVSAAPGVY